MLDPDIYVVEAMASQRENAVKKKPTNIPTIFTDDSAG